MPEMPKSRQNHHPSPLGRGGGGGFSPFLTFLTFWPFLPNLDPVWPTSSPKRPKRLKCQKCRHPPSSPKGGGRRVLAAFPAFRPFWQNCSKPGRFKVGYGMWPPPWPQGGHGGGWLAKPAFPCPDTLVCLSGNAKPGFARFCVPRQGCNRSGAGSQDRAGPGPGRFQAGFVPGPGQGTAKGRP